MANKTTKKTTKKAAPTVKKSTRTTKKVSTPARSSKAESVAPVTTTSTTKTQPAFRFKKSFIIPLLVVILLAALLYAGRSFFVAATVNGQPITRFEVISELEKQAGQQTLDSLVTKTLILQEAQKKNVTVTDQQIDEEIKKFDDILKQQGQSLDQALAMQGVTRESLRDQVRIRKTAEVLLGSDINVTEKEVTDYIASNSATIPEGMTEAQFKTSLQQQLRDQKLNQRYTTWLQELKQNANIDYITNY